MATHNQFHGTCQPSPFLTFCCKLFAPLSRQRVVPCFPLVFADAPFRRDPIPVFQSLQRQIKRTMVDKENLFRLPLYRSGNAVAVTWPEKQRLENQKVQRSLQQSNVIVMGLFGRHPTKAWHHSGRMSTHETGMWAKTICWTTQGSYQVAISGLTTHRLRKTRL